MCQHSPSYSATIYDKLEMNCARAQCDTLHAHSSPDASRRTKLKVKFKDEQGLQIDALLHPTSWCPAGVLCVSSTARSVVSPCSPCLDDRCHCIARRKSSLSSADLNGIDLLKVSVLQCPPTAAVSLHPHLNSATSRQPAWLAGWPYHPGPASTPFRPHCTHAVNRPTPKEALVALKQHVAEIERRRQGQGQKQHVHGAKHRRGGMGAGYEGSHATSQARKAQRAREAREADLGRAVQSCTAYLDRYDLGQLLACVRALHRARCRLPRPVQASLCRCVAKHLSVIQPHPETRNLAIMSEYLDWDNLLEQTLSYHSGLSNQRLDFLSAVQPACLTLLLHLAYPIHNKKATIADIGGLAPRPVPCKSKHLLVQRLALWMQHLATGWQGQAWRPSAGTQTQPTAAGTDGTSSSSPSADLHLWDEPQEQSAASPQPPPQEGTESQQIQPNGSPQWRQPLEKHCAWLVVQHILAAPQLLYDLQAAPKMDKPDVWQALSGLAAQHLQGLPAEEMTNFSRAIPDRLQHSLLLRQSLGPEGLLLMYLYLQLRGAMPDLDPQPMRSLATITAADAALASQTKTFATLLLPHLTDLRCLLAFKRTQALQSFLQLMVDAVTLPPPGPFSLPYRLLAALDDAKMLLTPQQLQHLLSSPCAAPSSTEAPGDELFSVLHAWGWAPQLATQQSSTTDVDAHPQHEPHTQTQPPRHQDKLLQGQQEGRATQTHPAISPSAKKELRGLFWQRRLDLQATFGDDFAGAYISQLLFAARHVVMQCPHLFSPSQIIQLLHPRDWLSALLHLDGHSQEAALQKMLFVLLDLPEDALGSFVDELAGAGLTVVQGPQSQAQQPSATTWQPGAQDCEETGQLVIPLEQQLGIADLLIRLASCAARVRGMQESGEDLRDALGTASIWSCSGLQVAEVLQSSLRRLMGALHQQLKAGYHPRITTDQLIHLLKLSRSTHSGNGSLTRWAVSALDLRVDMERCSITSGQLADMVAALSDNAHVVAMSAQSVMQQGRPIALMDLLLQEMEQRLKAQDMSSAAFLQLLTPLLYLGCGALDIFWRTLLRITPALRPQQQMEVVQQLALAPSLHQAWPENYYCSFLRNIRGSFAALDPHYLVTLLAQLASAAGPDAQLLADISNAIRLKIGHLSTEQLVVLAQVLFSAAKHEVVQSLGRSVLALIKTQLKALSAPQLAALLTIIPSSAQPRGVPTKAGRRHALVAGPPPEGHTHLPAQQALPGTGPWPTGGEGHGYSEDRLVVILRRRLQQVLHSCSADEVLQVGSTLASCPAQRDPHTGRIARSRDIDPALVAVVMDRAAAAAQQGSYSAPQLCELLHLLVLLGCCQGQALQCVCTQLMHELLQTREQGDQEFGGSEDVGSTSNTTSTTATSSNSSSSLRSEALAGGGMVPAAATPPASGGEAAGSTGRALDLAHLAQALSGLAAAGHADHALLEVIGRRVAEMMSESSADGFEE